MRQLPKSAPTAPDRRGRLAIVIDDIGWTRAAGERVIALPGRLTLAVLPGTPAGAVISRHAHAAGHEVILHQPMAAHGDALDWGPVPCGRKPPTTRSPGSSRPTWMRCPMAWVCPTTWAACSPRASPPCAP
ncbi:MAG: divergent polysaccharide deacetylase family protein [Gammaproteobacteria bacterium]|nr:divergent polysaccharide deacetylase family protein [Gammaproteobacteria bacterium]